MPVKIDVSYNPDIITNLLKELKTHTDAKCSQIHRDADFMITSMQQAFHLELIKLPTQVKQMSVKKFKEEYGCSLEAVTREVISGNDRSLLMQKGLVTPACKRADYSRARNPKEGEQILSANGSPLGSFSTVKKPLRPQTDLVPATPGVFVPLRTGEVLDLDSLEVDELTEEAKQDTLVQMQAMMDNMRAMMEKLKGGSV